jgi:hypothetical protein
MYGLRHWVETSDLDFADCFSYNNGDPIVPNISDNGLISISRVPYLTAEIPLRTLAKFRRLVNIDIIISLNTYYR